MTQRTVLNDLQRGLLTCLVRTPFLCQQDLTRELAAGRNSVYQCLNTLLAQGLLERVARPASAAAHGLCWLYTASPAGQLLVRQSLAATDLPPGRWEISERFLHSLLPRLDQLVAGRAVVHRLLMGASRAFACQGKPAVVRWSWIRDYEHLIPSRRDPGIPSGLRVFADWLLVLRILQADTRQEVCYPLFVFFDEPCFSSQVIGQRLLALQLWRQALASMRVLASEHFPPALILLQGWQRAWHWQQQLVRLTCEQATPLRGGLTVWTGGDVSDMAGDPWRLFWQPFLGSCAVPLCTLLSPISPQALPASWAGREHHQRLAGNVRGECPAHKPTRQTRSWALQQRAQRVDPTVISGQMLGLLGLSLQRAHYRALELLQACPLLSREELMVFLALQRGSAQRLLTVLQANGCLAHEVFPGEEEPRYSLSWQGLRLLALRHHLLPAGVICNEGSESAELAGLREKLHALRSRPASTGALYTFFARLIQQAAGSPGHRLLWWEVGDPALSMSTQGQRQPHAQGEYQAQGQRVFFWLDLQEAWSHAASIQQTLSGYIAVLSALDWQRKEPPVLLVVCPDEARERQVRHAVQQPGPFPWRQVFVTTRDRLLVQGPLAPIWQAVGPVRCCTHECEDTRRCWSIPGPVGVSAGHMHTEREM